MTKQDAINLLTQKDQLQLLSFYDTLTPEQQENLLAQIEGIDWSLLDVLKTHETVNARGTFAPLSKLPIYLRFSLSRLELQPGRYHLLIQCLLPFRLPLLLFLIKLQNTIPGINQCQSASQHGSKLKYKSRIFPLQFPAPLFILLLHILTIGHC